MVFLQSFLKKTAEWTQAGHILQTLPQPLEGGATRVVRMELAGYMVKH